MNKPMTTYERLIQNAEFKRAYDKAYLELLFSELLLAVMESDAMSVRRLAKEAGLSASVIQDIRSGKQADIKLSNLIKIAEVFGFQVLLQRGDEKLALHVGEHDKKSCIKLSRAK